MVSVHALSAWSIGVTSTHCARAYSVDRRMQVGARRSRLVMLNAFMSCLSHYYSYRFIFGRTAHLIRFTCIELREKFHKMQATHIHLSARCILKRHPVYLRDVSIRWSHSRHVRNRQVLVSVWMPPCTVHGAGWWRMWVLFKFWIWKREICIL